jgi:hypothetical protein
MPLFSHFYLRYLRLHQHNTPLHAITHLHVTHGSSSAKEVAGTPAHRSYLLLTPCGTPLTAPSHPVAAFPLSFTSIIPQQDSRSQLDPSIFQRCRPLVPRSINKSTSSKLTATAGSIRRSTHESEDRVIVHAFTQVPVPVPIHQSDPRTTDTSPPPLPTAAARVTAVFPRQTTSAAQAQSGKLCPNLLLLEGLSKSERAIFLGTLSSLLLLRNRPFTSEARCRRRHPILRCRMIWE